MFLFTWIFIDFFVSFVRSHQNEKRKILWRCPLFNHCDWKEKGSFYRRISICCWALTSFLYKRCLHCTSFLLCRIPTWHPTKVFRSSPFGKGFWTNLVSAALFPAGYHNAYVSCLYLQVFIGAQWEILPQLDLNFLT